VAKPFMRKRGSPNWGHPQTAPIPTLVTGFDAQMRKLGLTRETCARSAELRTWCERNRNRCYIPEWLLGEWGITVDDNVVSLRPAKGPSYSAARPHGTAPQK
jgi:hypothetical protein